VSTDLSGALDPALYRDVVRRALAEDLGWGDVTSESTVLPAQRVCGRLVTAAPAVVAGLDVALEAFRQLDPHAKVVVSRPDGSACAPGEVIAEVEARAQTLLTAERVALNFLQRLSGIATVTRQYVEAAGAEVPIVHTRRTTPLLRALEEHAVRAGGGLTHRRALDDGVFIDSRHSLLAGGVTEALARARRAQPDLPVQIEVQGLGQLDEALAAGAQWIVVADLPEEDWAEAVRRVRGHARLGLSGAISIEAAARAARTGLDFLAVGALTHAAPPVDIRFEVVPLA
jgi:nicotinate-nucleotide pyrophosphorylase (carboxylating)